MILDILSLALGILYIPLILAGSFITGGRNTTLRRLTLGMQLVVAALVVESLKLAVNLAMLPGSMLQIGLAIYCLVAGALTLKYVLRRRRLKGEEVVTEAERILREWHPGGRGSR